MKESTLLRLAFAFASLGFLASSESATAYHLWTTNGSPTGLQLCWRTGSPSPPWDHATKTLTYRLNASNFPAGGLPPLAQAGAALLNGFRSIDDLAADIRFRRGSDVLSTPAQNDGEFHVYFHTGSGLDPYGTDLTLAYAVTYPYYVTATGALVDADIFFNANPLEFIWSTSAVLPAPIPPAISADIEVTFIHEALHAVGLLHPVYFGASLWPEGRLPEEPLHDRIFAPDDRAGLRRIYPPASPLGRISGTVNIGAGAGERAIVVATDADGIPQASIHARSNGFYEISVPAGTYNVTAHHASNSTYNGEISFVGAAAFVNATTAAGVAVASGALTSGVNVSCTAGTPTMKLTFQGPPAGLGKQVQHLAQGSMGTLRLAVRSTPSATFSGAAIASIDLGPGINAVLDTVSALSSSTTAVDVDYNVDLNAVPGMRNVTLVRTNGERLFLPAVHAVVSTGTLSIAPGPANPAAGGFPTGAVDHPLLQARFLAGAEDVRLRRIGFTVILGGGAPAVPAFRLWRDVDSNGAADPAVDERILPSDAYALPVPGDFVSVAAYFDDIAVSLPAGTPVDLLLTMDADSAGSGDYSASLDAAGLADQAHGMAFGDILAPTGSAAGGTQTLIGLSADALGQFEFPAGTTPVPVGGAVTASTIVIRSVVTATSGTVGLDVEARPLGVAFTGTPTHSSAVSFPPLTDVAVDVGGLVDGTSYHWRVRPVGSSAGPGAWMLFGLNAETLRDFSRDTSTTTLLLPLAQRDANFALLPLGGTAQSRVYLTAAALNSAGMPVQLQVEVTVAGLPFNDFVTGSSAFVASGSTASALFTHTVPADWRWQARAVGAAGSASAWTDFGGNATDIDFHYVPGPLNVEDGKCNVGARSGGAPAGWTLLAALFLAALLGRRPSPATPPAPRP